MSGLARAERRSEGGEPGSRPARGAKPGEGPVFFAAGFWRRAAAAGIDTALISPVALGTAYVGSSLAGLRVPRGGEGPGFWLDLMLALDPALAGVLGLVFAAFVLYGLIFIGAAAQTPGMRVVGIRVIDLYGDPPSVARAAARAGGLLGGIASLGLGFLWIALDREKRSLSDWVAGTYAVKA